MKIRATETGKATHTPGPWMVDGTTATDNLDVIGEGGRVAMLDCDDIDADTLEANARLISAAPDLLACLLDVLDADGDLYAMDFDRYRAAIAKATGSSED